MRIALVLPGLGFGGAERIVEALALGVREAGPPVHVFATTRGGPIADALAGAGVPFTVVGLSSVLDLRAAARLRSALAQFRPTVVHSHLATADILAAAAGVGPRLITVHNPGVELDLLKRSLWTWALRGARARVAVSAAAADATPGAPPEVLHPSLVDAVRVARAPAAARRALGLPEAPLVLSLGRRTPIKGLDNLVAAARTHRGAQWWHLGPGTPPAEPGPVQFAPAVADVRPWLHAADVYVQSSRSEGFPQALLEALSAEVPVVATRVGGTAELLRGRGWLVPPGDPAQLAEAVRRVLSDPAGARAVAADARATLAERGLTRTAMVARYLELYRRTESSS